MVLVVNAQLKFLQLRTDFDILRLILSHMGCFPIDRRCKSVEAEGGSRFDNMHRSVRASLQCICHIPQSSEGICRYRGRLCWHGSTVLILALVFKLNIICSCQLYFMRGLRRPDQF